MEARVGVERHEVRAAFDRGDPRADLLGQDGRAHAIGRGQLGGLQGLELRGDSPPVREVPGLRRGIDAVEPIVGLAHTDALASCGNSCSRHAHSRSTTSRKVFAEGAVGLASTGHALHSTASTHVTTRPACVATVGLPAYRHGPLPVVP